MDDTTPGILDRARAAYAGLSPREQRLVPIWIGSMCLLLCILVGWKAWSSLADRQDRIDEVKLAIDDLQRKAPKLQSSQSSKDPEDLDTRIRDNDLKLTTFLDKEASKYNLKIGNFKESSQPFGSKRSNAKAEPGSIVEESVEINIDKADFKDLMRFLDAIERSPELVVLKRIDMRRPRRIRNGTAEPTVKVQTMVVSTFKRKKEN